VPSAQWFAKNYNLLLRSLKNWDAQKPDPRAANATYLLGDLIVMMIAASLCGANHATEFALFAKERK
jgi:hypothetical protein